MTIFLNSALLPPPTPTPAQIPGYTHADMRNKVRFADEAYWVPQRILQVPPAPLQCL